MSNAHGPDERYETIAVTTKLNTGAYRPPRALHFEHFLAAPGPALGAAADNMFSSTFKVTRARRPPPRLWHHQTITLDSSTKRLDVPKACTLVRTRDVADEREGARGRAPGGVKGLTLVA